MADSNSDYGIVYLLVNECMPGLVKIGKTSRKDMKARLRELYTTGVPLPFECRYACRVRLSHMDELERALHEAFAPDRVNSSREFFRIAPEQALPFLRLLSHITEGDATAEVSSELESEMNPEDVAALAKSRSRRPNLDYIALGLKPGDELVFKGNSSIRVAVVDAHRVLYDGDVQSLTSATRKILNKSKTYALQPTPYWSFNGEGLSEIYERVNPLSDE